jgi:hypothetical protein
VSNPHPSKPNPAARAAKLTEMADRRRKVAALHLARVPVFEIAKQVGVDPSHVSRDLVAIRAEWAAERRVDVEAFQSRDLAALEADEGSIRRRIASIPPDYHMERIRYHDLLLKIMDRRARLLGLDAPTKILATTQSRVAFTDDVAKILANPEATTALLDAVQGTTIAAVAVVVSPPPASNGNGANGAGH